MAITTYRPNKFKYLLATKSINLSTDVLKICLMNNTFTFDIDAHHKWGDISASEHAAGGSGYSTGGQTLTLTAGVEDDTYDRANFTFDPVSWTSAGGGISTNGAIIFDDTEAGQPDAIVMYLDFGGTQAIAAGDDLIIAGTTIRIL